MEFDLIERYDDIASNRNWVRHQPLILNVKFAQRSE